MGRDKVYRILVGKPLRKVPLIRSRSSWKENVKMDRNGNTSWAWKVDGTVSGSCPAVLYPWLYESYLRGKEYKCSNQSGAVEPRFWIAWNLIEPQYWTWKPRVLGCMKQVMYDKWECVYALIGVYVCCNWQSKEDCEIVDLGIGRNGNDFTNDWNYVKNVREGEEV
jgi:hypothetical protein